MSVEYEDIMMELVKTLGESNKSLLERISNIEKNGVTTKDIQELIKLSKEIHDDTQSILEMKTNAASSVDILTRWDKFWTSLSRGKSLIFIIITIFCAIIGFALFLLKMIQWFPHIKDLL